MVGNSQRDAVEKLAAILRPNAPKLDLTVSGFNKLDGVSDVRFGPTTLGATGHESQLQSNSSSEIGREEPSRRRTALRIASIKPSTFFSGDQPSICSCAALAI